MINEGRGQLQVISGQLDLQFMLTNAYREASMIPIKVPIYRGLLGLRLLLVKPVNKGEISSISSLDELRRYVGGHGRHWADLSIYPANRLPVSSNVSYQALFEQLKRGRFDYFHRGIGEIWQELDLHKEDLIIADNLMLFYPMPVYFFVSKARPELAQQIEKGLKLALADGSFKTLFLSQHDELLQKSSVRATSPHPINQPRSPLPNAGFGYPLVAA